MDTGWNKASLEELGRMTLQAAANMPDYNLLAELERM